MLIPSIDLMGGRIVQLVQGRELKLAFDDFEHWIERFSAYPIVQLIDLDAAMRQGSNRALIEQVAQRLPCQVGGGIGSIESARELLEAGARRVIIGSALFDSSGVAEADDTRNLVRRDFAQEVAAAVGAEHLVFSVDTREGRIAIKGWKQQVNLTPEMAIAALEPFCAAFLYTHIDREGTMQGFPLAVARRLRAVTKRQLIVAGGIREQAEIDALSAMDVDAVAGMAVYLGRLAV
ncbi:MAG TPA: HisA/HisF-related TIM barrel protein [Acidobacteriaceae bacterium]|jgi:phosphoribosylformimino-5-aminoimidazole carboxamide ribotide isomerase